MNSFWNNNIEAFERRFPDLAQLLASDRAAFEAQGPESPPFTVSRAKNGEPTATDGGAALHSKYNPSREAEQNLAAFDGQKHQVAVFLSFGLGHLPIAFARRFPSVPMVIIEENPRYLFAAFCELDWTELLSHRDLVFAVNAPVESVATLLRRYKSDSLCVWQVAAQLAHCQSYAAAVQASITQQQQKEEINTNTLERFAGLWLRNSCRNLHYLGERDGIIKFTGIPHSLPFIVLAAGPSLERILPHLAELKKRAIIVCVDTALHSCLACGVEPDFIVLVDPQYACALHLEFLAAPSSILITESAAWPSVFRFPCKEVVLCSSLFPIGQYFEQRLGSKGKLGAGGSVTTTAWDFARACGASAIFLAGMDLGFPGKQTHIRGSQFEERAHRTSTRIDPAELVNVRSLLSAAPVYAKDFAGNELLTDRRMSLFSWWFEKACQQASTQGMATYTLTPESLAIPGIVVVDVNDVLALPEQQEARAAFFLAAQQAEHPQSPHTFATVLAAFQQDMETLRGLARRGNDLCRKALQDRTKAAKTFGELQKIDDAILHSSAKDAAALVFPTERNLRRLTQNLPSDPQLRSLSYSRIIYTELEKAINEYLRLL